MFVPPPPPPYQLPTSVVELSVRCDSLADMDVLSKSDASVIFCFLLCYTVICSLLEQSINQGCKRLLT